MSVYVCVRAYACVCLRSFKVSKQRISKKLSVNTVHWSSTKWHGGRSILWRKSNISETHLTIIRLSTTLNLRTLFSFLKNSYGKRHIARWEARKTLYIFRSDDDNPTKPCRQAANITTHCVWHTSTIRKLVFTNKQLMREAYSAIISGKSNVQAYRRT